MFAPVEHLAYKSRSGTGGRLKSPLPVHHGPNKKNKKHLYLQNFSDHKTPRAWLLKVSKLDTKDI